VLHETDDRLQALQEAWRVCRWRVSVLERAYREEPKGPPLAHRLKEEYVLDLARQTGFATVESVPLQSMILYLFTR